MKLWHTSDFPTATAESVAMENGRERVRLQGVGEKDLDQYGFSRVWRRRPAHVVLDEQLHPSDREFAERECTIFRQALLCDLLPDAFWINPHDAAARAGRKLIQQRAAVEVGLTTPATLYSNDSREIRDFLDRHDGQAIYKVHRPVSWRRGREAYWIPYSSVVTADKLVEDELLQAVPGIFQEVVPKRYELRVTAMGHRLFATKLDSQRTTAGKIDWRRANAEIEMEPYVLPAAVANGCTRVLSALGLVFGCFDFIVTPAGEYVFLEVNEAGQFLFVERCTGQPLLDAFCEFLAQGEVEFGWDEARVRTRCRDVEAQALALAKSAQALHVGVPERSIEEQA